MTAQNTGIIQTQPIFSGNRTSIFGRNRTSIFSNPVSSSGILNTGNVFGTPNYDVSTDKSNNTNSQLSERTNQFASSIAVNVSKDTVTKTHKLFQNNTTPFVNKDPEIQFLKSSHTVNTEKYKTILKLEDGTEVLEPTSKDFKILNKNDIKLIGDKDKINSIINKDIHLIDLSTIEIFTVKTSSKISASKKFTNIFCKIPYIFNYKLHISNIQDIYLRSSLLKDEMIFDIIPKADKLTIQNKSIYRLIEYNEYLVIPNTFKEIIQNMESIDDIIDKNFLVSKYDKDLIDYINRMLRYSLKAANSEKFDINGEIEELNDISDMIEYYFSEDLGDLVVWLFTNHFKRLIDKSVIEIKEDYSIVKLDNILVITNTQVEKPASCIVTEPNDYLDNLLLEHIKKYDNVDLIDVDKNHWVIDSIKEFNEDGEGKIYLYYSTIH